jgi:hypothetical protein
MTTLTPQLFGFDQTRINYAYKEIKKILRHYTTDNMPISLMFIPI